jgi:inhibitor of KinA
VNAITADFGNVIDEKINEQVIALFHHWQNKKLAGVKDIIPAYSSLTIVYDVVVVRNLPGVASAYSFIENLLNDSINHVDWQAGTPAPIKEIPVCYDHSFAPDIESLAAEKKLPVEEIIRLHCDRIYRVYLVGFLPGFAYMGKVHELIATDRKTNPAALVQAGSVGIAGEQTGIYPLDSPGGWNIIGKTPLQMFDIKREDPVLLKAGDRVKFVQIGLQEFDLLRNV